MKSGLHVKAHSVSPEQQVVEVSWNGKLIATIYGADGPGIRLITKYAVKPKVVLGMDGIPVLEVRIDPETKSRCSGPG